MIVWYIFLFAYWICRNRRRKPVVVAVTASVTEEIKRECVEDLGMAVGEYGVNVKRGEFYR